MMKINKILNLIIYSIFALIFIFSTYFMAISYRLLNLNELSIFEDIIILLSVPIFIMVIFTKLLSFKNNMNIDDIRQTVFRFIYIIIVYFYTKCGLKMLDLEKISINNVLFLYSWMYFMLIGNSFFLIDRKHNDKVLIPRQARLKEKLKRLVLNNKDATNVYSFIIKYLPVMIYNIFFLYYSSKLSGDAHLIAIKADLSINPSNIQMLFIHIYPPIPYGIIKFIQILLVISMMIFSSILMISSFLNEKRSTYERKISRVFCLIFGIVVFCGISYSYLYIVDMNSFNDLKINFQLTPFGIIKLISHFLYFSLVTFTTTGYGDITPKSVISQCMVLIEMVIQIITITISLTIFFDWGNQGKIENKQNESKIGKGIKSLWRKIPAPHFKSEYSENIFKLIIVIIIEIVFFAGIYKLTSKWFYVKNGSKTFFDFFYFSVATLSTIGFGDIYPIKIITKFLVSVQMLFQMCLVLFGINIINSNFRKSSTENKIMVVKDIKQDFATVELEDRKTIKLPKQLLPKGVGKNDILEIKIEVKK